jgi:HK97 gp10 family phage protein
MSEIAKDNTNKVLSDVGTEVSKRLIMATLLVERTAKILCPVKTGSLKRSITHKFTGKNDAQIGSNLNYAPHVELGTRFWSGKPFLRPALHQNLKEIKRILGAK